MSNAIFPTLPGLMWDVKKTPTWSTKVLTSQSGKEARATYFSNPIYKWQLQYDVLRQGTVNGGAYQELQILSGFFNSRGGKLDSFLFSDPNDNSVTTHGFGVGDGVTTAFQLQRSANGPAQADNVSGVQPLVTTLRYNALKSSGDVSNVTYWGSNSSPTTLAPVVIGNAGLAPDESGFTATKIVFAAASGGQWSGWSQSAASVLGSNGNVAGQTWTFSVWLRADVATTISLILEDLPFSQGNGVTVNVTTQWQRFSVTFTYTTSNPGANCHIRNVGANAGRTVYAWGAQLEPNNSNFGLAANNPPTRYIPTTTAPVTQAPVYWPGQGDGFEPVYDLNLVAQPLQIVANGLSQYMYPRTNVLLWSQDFTNAVWQKQATVTVTGGQTDPFGGTNAQQVATTTVGNGVFQASAAAAAQGFQWTCSVWLRATAPVTVDISIARSGGFDQESTAINVTTTWQRFTFTHSTTWTGTTGVEMVIQGQSATQAFLAYGAQLELGTAATTYIPTTTAAVTVTDCTVSSSGLVTFAVAPVAGAMLWWTGSYYWRVRFDLDAAEFNEFLNQLWDLKTLTFVSVK